ncbi:hypothetical protein U1Q18_023420 [Sarracenia purpurea var. burkii]
MERGREREEYINSHGPFDSFGSFGGFGTQRSMMSSIFGGRDPFDDPFFTSPFGSIFGSSLFNSGGPSRDLPQTSRSKGPIIEELHTDDEEKEKDDDSGIKEEKDAAKLYIESNKNPYVEHPDDQTDEKKSKDVAFRTDYNRVEGINPQARSVSFQKVTYGGINGAYYTATASRRTGSDGVLLEECKQADRTTGQATHRLSRGIQDKGHSVTRKLNSDGKVDTMQTLHNLNEDELAGFEQAWEGNAERHFPSLDDGFTFDDAGTGGGENSGWVSGSRMGRLPSEGFFGRAGGMGAFNNEARRRVSSSGGRPKKVVTINIE